MKEYWAWFSKYVVDEAPTLAYDCGWETYLSRLEMEHAASYDWVRVRDYLQKFRLSTFVVNIGGAAEQSGDYVWSKGDIIRRFPNAAFVHGPLATSSGYRRGSLAVGRLRQEGQFAKVDNGVLAICSAGGARMGRSIWLPGGPLKEETAVAVHYTMDFDVEAGIAVAISDPSGRSIATSRRSGAARGQPRGGRCIAKLPAALPYVKIDFHFSGPEGAEIQVRDIRVKLNVGDDSLGVATRILEA